MINLDTAKFCIWGFKNTYHTHGHIHAGFQRALEATGRKVIWVDAKSDLSGIDFGNTFFITQNDVVKNEVERMPLRKDCFYAVHNGLQGGREKFDELDWLNFSMRLRRNPTAGSILLAPEVPLFVKDRVVEFFWGTDLLPWEIEKNKPSQVFNSSSRVVNFVVSAWQGAQQDFNRFQTACEENGIAVEWYGLARKGGIVSIEENARLIKESYLAPSLVSEEQNRMGYIPCRIFKHFSYGQYGLTNSEAVNTIFDGRLICNQDAHQLFYDARTKLPSIPLKDLHALMDYVAANHTYLNRVDVLLKSARLILENK